MVPEYRSSEGKILISNREEEGELLYKVKAGCSRVFTGLYILDRLITPGSFAAGFDVKQATGKNINPNKQYSESFMNIRLNGRLVKILKFFYF